MTSYIRRSGARPAAYLPAGVLCSRAEMVKSGLIVKGPGGVERLEPLKADLWADEDMPDAEIMKLVVDRFKFAQWLASFGSNGSRATSRSSRMWSRTASSRASAVLSLDPLLEGVSYWRRLRIKPLAQFLKRRPWTTHCERTRCCTTAQHSLLADDAQIAAITRPWEEVRRWWFEETRRPGPTRRLQLRAHAFCGIHCWGSKLGVAMAKIVEELLPGFWDAGDDDDDVGLVFEDSDDATPLNDALIEDASTTGPTAALTLAAPAPTTRAPPVFGAVRSLVASLRERLVGWSRAPTSGDYY